MNLNSGKSPSLGATSPTGLSAAVVYVAARVGWWWYTQQLAAQAAAEREHAAIAARADQQHAWVLAGDDRGIYGKYPPAAV